MTYIPEHLPSDKPKLKSIGNYETMDLSKRGVLLFVRPDRYNTTTMPSCALLNTEFRNHDAPYKRRSRYQATVGGILLQMC